MEYVQLTLNDWLEVKQRLKMELQGIKQSFVRIGYVLRKIDEQRLYENDGYKSIAEFAKSEYGLEASTVSRFMSINREYSIGGYSEHLREEYLDLSRSQLEEMLKLPESDRTMIQPETARDDIRGLKKFNKAEPVEGVADDIVQLIEKFYEENPKILNELYSEPVKDNLKRAIEIVNPAGNRSFKKGMFFLMMYENRIVFKKFGTNPENMTWELFFEITYAIFEESENGPKTWEKHFGKESESVAVPEEKEPEKTEENIVEKEPENEIAPAQKIEENQGILDDFRDEKEVEKDEPVAVHDEQLPGQMEVADYPELMPESPMGQVIESITRDAYEVAVNIEPEEIPNNEVESSKEKQEEPPKTIMDTFREAAELEKIAIAENDAIRRKFMAFSRGRMPVAELELVREHAEKTLKAINEMISLKKGL